MADIWYEEGLAFTCQGCGGCCRGPGGYVWLTEEEAENIAEFLNMEKEAFYKKYIKIAKGKLAIVDNHEDDCIFLDENTNGCKIYNLRPAQCRTFPWWPELLRNKEIWDNNNYNCPGINRGNIHSCEEIRSKILIK